MMLGVHIADKYIFKINDVVMYHHRGSTSITDVKRVSMINSLF